jgi:predicted dehydrogenase
MIRLAIVGCGQISERFFRQAARRPDAGMVAACARRLESARTRANEFGVPAAYDNWERMFDEVNPDGVIIATPHSLHAAPAVSALRRGIHVLCEKPMATTLADCHAMVEAARSTGALLMCLPFDHTPAYLTLLNHLREETIGRVTGADSQLNIPGPPRDNWYYRREVAHGGAMLDCLVYPMSRVISLLGPAARVTGLVNTLIPHRIVAGGARVESDVDDNVTLIVEWPGGQQAVVRTLWGTSYTRNDTAIYGRRGTLWLSGSRVVVHAPHGAPAAAERLPDGAWLGLDACYELPIAADTPQESIVDHFVECIVHGRPPRCDGELQLHVHECLFRGYMAAATGRTQELASSFVPWHSPSPSLMETRDGFL